MEKIKGLAIELDLDHLSVDRGLKGLKDNLKTVNSEMKRNMSAFDFGERSVKKYETSLSGLNKKLEVQKRAVAEAKKEYEEMVKEHGHGSKEAEKAAREYNNQAAALNNLERYIERTKKELADFEKKQRIANSNWTKMGDKLESYGGKLKTFGSQMDDVGSKMTNKITKPALVATTAAAGLVGALGWKRLTGLDAAQAQLKGLGYSTKEVGRISDQVTTAIDGGMTTMAEGTAVAAGALAAGVKEGKELERYIKLVGDAAVGANRPVEEMAMIFNRVQGNGKLMTQELNSIEQGMPGFSKAMSKHLGVSSEKFREMVTDGKVSSKDFLKVMEDFAGGMASAYAESWDGMVANTKAYIGIIGENFLRGIFQDSKKSLADFIEMLKSPEIQQRAAEMGETARVAFNKMKDSIMDVVEWYQNLDDGQKQMIRRLGLMVVAGGPALQLAGKLTSGLGSVLKVTGKLSKAIGVARGAGLVAGLTSLGPMAVGGIAVAGLAAVGGAAYSMYKEKKKANEVSLDLAESLTDEAIELEKAAESFDKLSGKAKISNAELAELNDLNIRISQSSNPGEIEALQNQYDELAKKSGLSKDELKKLFEANETIIDQTPNLKTSISEQGNAFAENTDRVNEYVQAMLESSRVELGNQRKIALKEEERLLDEIAKKNLEIEDIERGMLLLDNASLLSKEQIESRLQEISELYQDQNVSAELKEALVQEEIALRDILTDKEHEARLMLQDQLTSKRESVEASEEELAKIREMDWEYANILLKQAGINEEGEKGLANLDKAINKNKEELEDLESKLEKNGSLSEKEQERYDKLSATVERQNEAKDIINTELELYKDLNSLVEGRISKLSEEEQQKINSLAKSTEIKVEEGNIVKQLQNKNSEYDKGIEKLEKEKKEQGANKKEINEQITDLKKKKAENDEVIKKVLQELGLWDQVKDSIETGTEKEKQKGNATDQTKSKLDKQGNSIDKNNQKTDAGIKKEQERSKEAGKDVSKTVSVTDGNTVNKLNERAIAPRSKLVQLRASNVAEVNRQASSPVTKVINFVGKGLSKLKFWEKGTPPSGHPGGPAVIGEKGSELVRLPSGRSFLSPSSHTLLDLPRGAHVVPHQETKRIIKNAPRYATGTDGWASSLGNSELARLLSLYNKTSESNIVVRGESDSNDNGEVLKLLMEQNEYLKKSNDLLARLLGKDLDLYKLNRKVDEGLNIIGNRKNAAWGG